MLVLMCWLWANLGSWSGWNPAFWVDFQLPEQAFCVVICMLVGAKRRIHPGCCSLTCIWPTAEKHSHWPPQNCVWLSICMQVISQTLKEGLLYVRARCWCFGGKIETGIRVCRGCSLRSRLSRWELRVGTACSTRSRPGDTNCLVFSNVNPKIHKSCLAKFSQSL